MLSCGALLGCPAWPGMLGVSHQQSTGMLSSDGLLHGQVTQVNLGGYLIAFGGVCWYNYGKLQSMKAKQAASAAGQRADVEGRPNGTAGKNGEKSPLVDAKNG